MKSKKPPARVRHVENVFSKSVVVIKCIALSATLLSVGKQVKFKQVTYTTLITSNSDARIMALFLGTRTMSCAEGTPILVDLL